ncbi:CAZyme family AA3 [Trichoderma aggressivum f. europaeum]|uniref:CAZyme family AA3 n=1 Tax=Trichoderma aggressivum f. europaeum TaxID=173218 RepID=A0AAE1J5H3_9HYPO|nr:CAZyme family AA3 [Trichoderma aggressivum f. europaeum]
MSEAETHYDFIVVGSGPAGCATASGLSRSPKKPSVLLIEAGDDHTQAHLRVDGQRWTTFTQQSMNTGYQTAPQPNCNNRVIAYDRGRGLGGSSTINFGVWTTGPRDDFDEWARLVNDPAFAWDSMQSRFKMLETFHFEVPTGTDPSSVSPKTNDHGSAGPLHVGYASEWERDIQPLLQTFRNMGGLRSVAADLLQPKPDNLTIVTGSAVQRVLLDGKRAVGIDSNGKHYFATHEVILCAGALDSPKILLHSGIGPADQLSRYDIPVVHDVPAVGQGLRDHAFLNLVVRRNESDNDRRSFYGSQEAMDAAQEQWNQDRTGPWSVFGCENLIGFFKSDSVSSSMEFQNLPPSQKEFLLRETVPHYELLTHFPIHYFIPGFAPENLNYETLLIFLLNEQSRGEVTLQSADPNVPLKFDPNFLSHPFDQRVCIEALRAGMAVIRNPLFAKGSEADIVVPKVATSDHGLLQFWRENMTSSWHMVGTAKMGRLGDRDAVVDANFKVLGLSSLRVADNSVLPILPNAHTQSSAYVTGMTCAEKLIAEYQLDQLYL